MALPMRGGTSQSMSRVHANPAVAVAVAVGVVATAEAVVAVVAGVVVAAGDPLISVWPHAASI